MHTWMFTEIRSYNTHVTNNLTNNSTNTSQLTQKELINIPLVQVYYATVTRLSIYLLQNGRLHQTSGYHSHTMM